MVWSGGLDFLANETYGKVPEIHQAQNGGDNGFIGVENNFKNYNLLGLGVWNRRCIKWRPCPNYSSRCASYLKRDADVVFNQATQLIPGHQLLGQGFAQAISQMQSEIEELDILVRLKEIHKDQFIATLGYRADKSSLNGDPNKFYGFQRLRWQLTYKILETGIVAPLIS